MNFYYDFQSEFEACRVLFEKDGLLVFEISSGQIHKAMKLKDRFPSVCNAMVKINEYPHEIIKNTASGKSSTKIVRYYLK
ncbi:hypothetical protein [Clostridium algidicarnis]|uniref:hypothetical protein n=1 Tax=Clostridium algidicarnis TaxID=37659 RepID=UPI001C0B07C3|nr:hypothetical protein [Clostridium algidicarnis]MBU3209036.1 hypothetical protein [Clostridium algidicarnis]MBU3228758.1 hypothetical protein [Clostridium algidicarnis]MBU3252302.1 hypothetical protein [Clostridium algidicarnis]